MDYRMLGPLEVRDHSGEPLPLGAGRPRVLLGLLLVRANELVTSERVVADLWGECPPATAAQMVQNAISTLRRSLALDGRLETRGSAYRLRVDDGERDVDRFEALVARGRELRERDPAAAAAALREALGVWRGDPLADLAYEGFAQPEIARLEEARRAAFEARVDAELALGRHAEMVPELEAALAAEPLRERLHAQLMLALYRSGRQSDALEAYRRAHRRLVEDIGVEPGPDLRALHAAVLAHDPALRPSPPPELPAELEGGSPLLAGRESELALLRDRLAARSGRGGVVVICGPEGIGKTRLAAELAREATAERILVQYVSGRAPDATYGLNGGRDARPRLLVADDLDAAPPALLNAVAGAARGPVLVLALQRAAAPPPELAEATVLALAPLAPAAIERIARLHLPAAADVPVRELLAETDGVPLAVHRAATAWARARVTERLSATIDQAAAGRGQLRAAQTSLAGTFVDLQHVHERGERYIAAAPVAAVCPYLGLAAYDTEHAAYFCGRERLLGELVARLAGASLLVIVGPSGSGKSSALRAGLLPALASGALPGSDGWRQALLRPGERPAAELDRALREAAGAKRLVVAVDQFEEAFTACRDPAERTAFFDALVAAAQAGTLVLLALRADYYGRCAAHHDLAALAAANQVLVGAMRPDELRRAIERPAELAGLTVEPELAEALVADVAGEPGGLPLLSTTLVELWRERDGRTLRMAAYERSGGVRGAVARLAEQTYARLSPPAAQAARRILLRLAQAGDEVSFVRRRVPLAELDLERDADAATALTTLTESRLVTVDDGVAEVAHEALLHEWPRLRAWLEEDAEGRRLHAHLTSAAHDWVAAARDPTELYRGQRLAAAAHWSDAHAGDLNALEHEFVAASRAHAARDADRQRRANRRLRATVAGIAVLLAAAVVAGAVALSQRATARHAAIVADAQRLGAQALTDDRVDRGLLLARAGTALDDSVATRSSLLSELARHPAAIGVLPGTANRPNYNAISPDGRTLAIEDNAATVLLVNPMTHRLAAPPLRADGGLDFSSDGRTLAVATTSGARELTVDFVDVASGRVRRHLDLGPAPAVTDPQVSALFGPRFGELVIADVSADGPDGPPTELRRYDLARGAWEGGWRRLGGHTARVARSPNRRWLVVSDAHARRAYVLDAATLAVRRTARGDFESAIDSTGEHIAEGSMGGTVRLVDARTGAVQVLTGRHEGAVNRMAFTADGRTLVTAGLDGTAFVWDVARGEVRDTLAGHRGLITDISLSPDGRTAFTSSLDGTSIAWDLAGDRRFGRPFADAPLVGGTPPALAVSPDGAQMVVSERDGTLRRWNLGRLQRSGALRRRLPVPASALAFSPDGSRLATVAAGPGRYPRTVHVLDAGSGLPDGPPLRGLAPGGSQTVAWSHDGRLVAAGDYAGDVHTWNARTGAPGPLSVSRLGDPVLSVAFSPDGRRLAATFGTGGAGVYDVASGRLVATLGSGDEVRWVAWSPDERLLVTGHYDGRARLWTTATWRPAGTLAGHEGYVLWAGFSPDGRTLATSGTDGTALLWDVAARRQIGSALTVDANQWTAASFTPDGRRLVALAVTGRGVAWPTTHRDWERHACAVAGRSLTRREWADAVPDQPYRPVCG